MWGSIDLWDPRLDSRVVGVVDVWKYFKSGDSNLSSPGAAGRRPLPKGQLSPRAGSMTPSQSAITQWGWGFHTLWGGIDAGDLRFRPRVVGVDEIWTDFLTGNLNLSSPGAAGPRRCPGGQLSPRAGSMSLSQVPGLLE